MKDDSLTASPFGRQCRVSSRGLSFSRRNEVGLFGAGIRGQSVSSVSPLRQCGASYLHGIARGGAFAISNRCCDTARRHTDLGGTASEIHNIDGRNESSGKCLTPLQSRAERPRLLAGKPPGFQLHRHLSALDSQVSGGDRRLVDPGALAALTICSMGE